jgi:photosystem II stability/assembly factor-like uncharacterized protein
MRGAGATIALATLVGLAIACRPGVPADPTRPDLAQRGPSQDESARPWRPLALHAPSDWEPLGLPAEGMGPVHQVAAVPDRAAGRPLLAVVGQAVYRSLDAGSHWEPWPLALGPLPPNARLELSYSPTYAYDRTVFALVRAPTPAEGLGLYRSEDGGATWEWVLAAAARRVEVSPTFVLDHTLVVLGARWTGEAWVSRDRGGSWAALAAGDEAWFSPTYARDGLLFVTRYGRLLRQHGPSDPWLASLDDASVRGLAFSPRYRVDNTVYAYGRGVFRSTNSGTRWSRLSLDLGDDDRVMALVTAPTPGLIRALLAVVERGGEGAPRYQIMRSLDEGNTWAATSGEWPIEDVPGQPTFAPATPGRVYLPTAHGLWVSDDFGDTWRDLTPSAAATEGAPTVQGLALATGRSGSVEVCFLATDEGLWRRVTPAAIGDDS